MSDKVDLAIGTHSKLFKDHVLIKLTLKALQFEHAFHGLLLSSFTRKVEKSRVRLRDVDLKRMESTFERVTAAELDQSQMTSREAHSQFEFEVLPLSEFDVMIAFD